jgi:acyl-CoA thioesterase-1
MLRKLFLIGATCLFHFYLFACSQAPLVEKIATSSPEFTQPSLTILAFGDSLTAGYGVDPSDSYPAQLGRKLQADGYPVEVINGGISGETSSAALSRVEWMLETEPDIVIVETGGNDALRGVDLTITRANIAAIVRQFDESGAVVVIAGLQIIQNLGSEYTDEFGSIYPEVAEQYGVALIPFMLEGLAADPELNQTDFIHPNAEGYAVMVDHIYPYIVEAIIGVQAE